MAKPRLAPCSKQRRLWAQALHHRVPVAASPEVASAIGVIQDTGPVQGWAELPRLSTSE
ncbi:MAG: hypothetical protein CM1200mP14_12630 [Gammaproteobacteria bacterium]|nr:MAG: hypothetical protein CM1200mP14_12630 [Gammaproteobacteria bacterium]